MLPELTIYRSVLQSACRCSPAFHPLRTAFVILCTLFICIYIYILLYDWTEFVSPLCHIWRTISMVPLCSCTWSLMPRWSIIVHSPSRNMLHCIICITVNVPVSLLYLFPCFYYSSSLVRRPIDLLSPVAFRCEIETVLIRYLLASFFVLTVEFSVTNSFRCSFCLKYFRSVLFNSEYFRYWKIIRLSFKLASSCIIRISVFGDWHCFVTQ